MNPSEACQLLKSLNTEERLRAARYLMRFGREEDIPVLRAALSTECHKWIISALNKAISQLLGQHHQSPCEVNFADEEDRMAEQIKSEAVEETTIALVHEIRTNLLRVELSAHQEIENYANSNTKTAISHVQSLMSSIEQLATASKVPAYEQFDLHVVIETAALVEFKDKSIAKIGSNPALVYGDPELIGLIFANGLRNAVESYRDGVYQDVIVNWGDTDKDYWVAILDEGVGLPPASHKAFDIGVTNKKNHHGMGLALSKRAIVALSGSVTLTPRTPTGVKFEFRWPKRTYENTIS